MIFYLTKRGGTLTWRRSLERVDTDIALRRELLDRIRLLPYETMFRKRSHAAGSYVFTDLDRLSVEETERAAVVWNALADAKDGFRLFNHPIRSMRRYELLRHLYEKNVNSFNAYRLTDPLGAYRFPVFIRAEDDHRGNLTPLLYSVDELNDAIENLVLEGKSRDNKIVIEYLDTRDETGLHHRYSAFVVDSQIFFTSVVRSDQWVVKPVRLDLGGNPPSPEEKRHESHLKKIFDMAHINYGRMDYAIVNGRLEVFEINTNPMLTPPKFMLKISRAINCPSTGRKITVKSRYQLPWKEHKSKWYWIGRLIHWTLRLLNLMVLERPIVRTLGKLKRWTLR